MPKNIYIYDPNVPVPKNVRHVEIPGGTAVIKSGAFSGCSRLESIIIPDSVTEIGDYAFQECLALRSVTIPDSVTEIGYAAFNRCVSLQSVTMSSSITEIRNFAFYECSSLQSIRIPDGVTKIGDGAFDGCTGLRSVIIPVGVTEIEGQAFYRCSSLQSVAIPDGITRIAYNTFSDCSGLQSITIPDSVTQIDDNAFCRCSSLQSVTIPDNVTKIGFGAFLGCSALRSVTIPDHMTVINYAAFMGCSGLRTVTIPDGVTDIGGDAFSNCSGLQSVTIPGSVEFMGAGAFRGCSDLQSVTIPNGITEIESETFRNCSRLQSIVIPDGVTKIGNKAFADCPALQSLIYKGINISPFINIDGYGIDTFSVIRTLVEHHIPLSSHTVKTGIDMAHQGKLFGWIQEYPVFGTMHLQPAAKSADAKTEEYLRRLFAVQKKTGCRVPEILDKLTIAVCTCGIPPERLAETFDIEYTRNLLSEKIPIVPAEACRCYYDRGTCNMLIRKGNISVMAEAIGLYNRSGHQECYRHLMDFILSHPDTKVEDLQYAADHAEEIPMQAGTTLTQIRQHRIYMENLAEVEKIEAKYGKTVPGFKLTDYPCSIEPTDITYDGMTARVLDLSDNKDIALAARLGDLTNCCQRLGRAGETAMMHGFLNPDAGFWVIEDKDGKVKAQAEIWKTNNGNLVFDNIEFADTDDEHLTHRVEQLRGAIAAWAMESGYENIIMGCGFSELGTGFMEQASIPKLCLTPEEVFALQKGNDTCVSFRNMDDVHQYMQTEKYRPGDFVYTDADEQCVYIKKDGIVSDYLMQGYDCTLAEKYPASGYETEKERSGEIACK